MEKLVLGISGSAKRKNSSSEYLLNEALEGAKESGSRVKLIRLADYNIIPCTGCGLCMAKKHCPLLKNTEDQRALLYEECIQADAFIFSAPVYAFSVPAMWKNWLDRCEPCTDDDLAYNKNYGYELSKDIKGKALKGKVAGLISVSAGLGHEIAWSSLSPVFTCLNLTVVANVGLSLNEFDSQPAIRTKPWAKDIKEAEFAKVMVRCLGKRVYDTINVVSNYRKPS